MELVTKDGKFFIDEAGYKAIHDLKHMLPEARKTLAITMSKVDANIKDAKIYIATLAKCRRYLADIDAVMQKMAE